jgi:hypothetical protein
LFSLFIIKFGRTLLPLTNLSLNCWQVKDYRNQYKKNLLKQNFVINLSIGSRNLVFTVLALRSSRYHLMVVAIIYVYNFNSRAFF